MLNRERLLLDIACCNVILDAIYSVKVVGSGEIAGYIRPIGLGAGIVTAGRRIPTERFYIGNTRTNIRRPFTP